MLSIDNITKSIRESLKEQSTNELKRLIKSYTDDLLQNSESKFGNDFNEEHIRKHINLCVEELKTRRW